MTSGLPSQARGCSPSSSRRGTAALFDWRHGADLALLCGALLDENEPEHGTAVLPTAQREEEDEVHGAVAAAAGEQVTSSASSLGDPRGCVVRVAVGAAGGPMAEGKAACI